MITLKTLAAATDQEVFDQVATHLLKQNAKSVNSHGCAYRGSSGMKCAAGCLIGDEEYDPRMEDRSWTSLVRDSLYDGPSRGLFPKDHRDLIRALQIVHDCNPVEEWREELKRVASAYYLDWNH